MKNLENVCILINLNSNLLTDFAKQMTEKKDELLRFKTYFQNPERNVLTGKWGDFSKMFKTDLSSLVTTDELINNDSIIFAVKNDTDSTLVVKTFRLNPEIEHDWFKVIEDFLINYSQETPDKNGFYKWGQIVRVTGEYLCVDCGYIFELNEGDVFPICEVCLSGDITSPDSKTDKGYWELV